MICQIRIPGQRLPIRVSGQSVDQVVKCQHFQQWMKSFDHRRMRLSSIHIHSADIFEGGRVVFIKFEAEAYLRKRGRQQPLNGIVFARGNAIAIFIFVTCRETGEIFVLIARQPRVALGAADFAELVAGTLDKEDGPISRTLAEVQEEAGVKLRRRDLFELGTWVPSAGGCDEQVTSFCAHAMLSASKIGKIKAAVHGAQGENEQIRIELHSIQDFVWRLNRGSFRDGKMLATLMLMLLRLDPDDVVQQLRKFQENTEAKSRGNTGRRG